MALAPISRLASQDAHRAGRWPLGAARSVAAPPAPGAAARSPGSGSGSRPGSGAATGHSFPHDARVGRPGPRRSAAGAPPGDRGGRDTGNTDSGGGALGASVTSREETDTVPHQAALRRHPAHGAREVAEDSGWLLFEREGRDEDLKGTVRTGSHRALVMNIVDVVKNGHVGGVAPIPSALDSKNRLEKCWALTKSVRPT